MKRNFRILLARPQMAGFDYISSGMLRSQRGSLLWLFNASFNSLERKSEAKQAIKDGMSEWVTKTCIRFKKRRNESSYVYFKLGEG